MASSSSSGMFSMSSSSSSNSNASLARSQTRTSLGSARSRPRPRSPPSMYVAYESAPVKAPKPLIKLDKKSKNKPAPLKASSSNPPTRERALTSPSTPSAVSDSPPQRRPSVSSFLSLRRKTPVAAPATPAIPLRKELPPPLHVPLPRPVHLHQTNVHPVDDIQLIPRRSDKAARMLGKSHLDIAPQHEDGGVVVSDFSGTFRIPPRAASKLDEYDENSSLGGGSSVDYDDDDEPEDESFIDDEHIHRQSRLLSPIEFAPVMRPPSELHPRPPPPEDEDDEWAQPITPVAPLPPSSRPQTGSAHDAAMHHARHESYASVHNHYSNHPSRESAYNNMQFRPDTFRPDTPFLDTLIAVNSKIAVVSPSRQGTHIREASVVRTETKEGWMGEWNQDDMQDVIQKLRSLK